MNTLGPVPVSSPPRLHMPVAALTRLRLRSMDHRLHQQAAATAAVAATAAAPFPWVAVASTRGRRSACHAASTKSSGHQQTAGPGGGDWSGWSGASGSTPDPLLRSIRQSSTAGELHQLLLRHSGELGGREVAAALEVAAHKRLLQAEPPGQRRASGGGGGGSPLAPLLVQLADKYAPVMDPPALAASAWALAALQLAPARPVMVRMHALAEAQLAHFAPSQLCALLWAGGSLAPGTHSPLFSVLAGYLKGGMSLALFDARDLAALAYLCGREGGVAARDISIAVADECRSRLADYAHAVQQAQRAGSTATKRRGRPAGSGNGSSGDSSDGSDGDGAAAGLSVPLPSPPFTPADAAMLLTGLAQQQLRVPGVVEPLLRQCEGQLAQAQTNDVARILIAMGELLMEIATEPMQALLTRLCREESRLSPQQVASALWACQRLGMQANRQMSGRLASMAGKHFGKRAAAYRAVDVIGLVWGVAQMQRTLADDALAKALRAVQPELAQQSTAGLTNLLWALGKHADQRASTRAEWLAQPVGSAAQCVAELALAELARRARGMQPSELSAAAAALAVHPPLAAALPGSYAAALRDACGGAAAANELLSYDVAQLATAAAKLRWVDRAFVDALAFAVQQRINLTLTTSEVYSQSVWALATLAPGRYPELFVHLANAYALKMKHPERLPAHTACFQPEERSTVLAAFAAVARAQGLPARTLQDLLSTVSGMDLRQLPLSDAVPLLQLAAEARAPQQSPVVQACCRSVKTSFPRLSLDTLRSVRCALGRWAPGGDPAVSAVLLAVEQHIASLENEEHGNAA